MKDLGTCLEQDMVDVISRHSTPQLSLAVQIAGAAPLAVRSTRGTLRMGLVERVAAALERELEQQRWLSQTEDAREGVSAVAGHRTPVFRNC